jgi:prepilin-type N-terminal cleavage/methylation domain-containing protein
MRSRAVKHSLHGKRTRAAGFTLVESLIAVTLLAILFLSVAQTSSRASDAFDEGSVEHALSQTAHRGVERLSQALEFANQAAFAAGNVADATLGDDHLDFQVPQDFANGEVQWTPIQITTEIEPGELKDGLDNDGDGLIDELRVVKLETVGADEVRTVLASGVPELFLGETANNLDDNGNGLKDEAGLSFLAEGNVMTIRLTCQRRDDGGRLLTKTAETAVRLRN